jgi:hypothetical protein
MKKTTIYLNYYIEIEYTEKNNNSLVIIFYDFEDKKTFIGTLYQDQIVITNSKVINIYNMLCSSFEDKQYQMIINRNSNEILSISIKFENTVFTLNQDIVIKPFDSTDYDTKYRLYLLEIELASLKVTNTNLVQYTEKLNQKIFSIDTITSELKKINDRLDVLERKYNKLSTNQVKDDKEIKIIREHVSLLDHEKTYEDREIKHLNPMLYGYPVMPFGIVPNITIKNIN